MHHTTVPAVKVVKVLRSNASPARTRAALEIVERMDHATKLLVSAPAEPKRENSSMVPCARSHAGCWSMSLTGLDPWTNGAGPLAERTSCSLESSVMELVMHSTILPTENVLVLVRAQPHPTRRFVLSTATMRIGGRNSILLVANSAARTTLLLDSSEAIATLSIASKWPSVAKYNAVSGMRASGLTSRVPSVTGTAKKRMAALTVPGLRSLTLHPSSLDSTAPSSTLWMG